MTDNDIIKALKCCILSACNCTGGCPYRGTSGKYTGEECWRKVREDVFDLIHRQKAKIERLESNLKFVRGTVERLRKYDEERDVRLHAKLTETARAEAIKEFAERVKDIVDEPALIRGRIIDTIIARIDSLVKEMTE